MFEQQKDQQLDQHPDPHPLSAAQVDRYHHDGFLAVPGLFSEAEVLAWKQHTIAALQRLNELGNPSGVHVWMCESLDPDLRLWVSDQHIVDILAQLVGANVEFLSVKSVFKDRNLRFASPWHQDWFYWRGTNKVSVWIALDDAVAENGCLRFIPRSHRSVQGMVHVEAANGFVLRVPEEAVQGQPIVAMPVRRGDAVFFHDLTLHSSYENNAGTDRWSLIATYRDASLKDDSDVWKSAIVLRGTSVNT